MLALQQVPPYSATNRSPVASTHELWRLARFIAEIMEHSVTVEGVEFATAPGDGSSRFRARPLVEGQSARTVNIGTSISPTYRFKRSRGVLLASELRAYDNFISGQLAARDTSAGRGVKQARHLASGPSSLAFDRV